MIDKIIKIVENRQELTKDIKSYDDFVNNFDRFELPNNPIQF